MPDVYRRYLKMGRAMRVLIVAPNISTRMGGEAIIPWHYIRELSALGVEVHALTHERVRQEILESDINTRATFHFADDALIEKGIHKSGAVLPYALRETISSSAIGLVTMLRLARRARRLERERSFDVIHQPTPVSPMFPSFLHKMDAPVVIGPMNGAMNYPPAFRKDYSRGAGAVVGIGRPIAAIANVIAPGKPRAAKLLVANERTADGLPGNVKKSKVEILVENGVDLDLWSPPPTAKSDPPTFVYVGRLVWMKALELLIEAFAKTAAPARLQIIGDGPERETLEAHARAIGAAGDRIEFLGFRPQAEIADFLARATALVLPSLRECGGAVVLEAFACNTTAIATKWGGPCDYITDDTGFLVPPESREEFVMGLAERMTHLAMNQDLAERLGVAARKRVEEHFTWKAKAAKILDIYKELA
ncbi:MAG: glycosyltransferase family 4 protein [Marinicaulis sp.]|nr:glycosyltransferase family 4 protein [Marinicaulis sp.]